MRACPGQGHPGEQIVVLEGGTMVGVGTHEELLETSETYREIVQYLGDDDPTSRKMMEEILASEEEHAEDLRTLLENLGDKGEPAARGSLKQEFRPKKAA